jgi:large subunit ribosomal protein L10
MTRQEKKAAVAELKDKFSSTPFFYLADSSAMSVAQVSDFRRRCFEQGVEMKVVKNTLAIKAIEQLDNKESYENVLPLLKGTTAVLFTTTANLPGKILKEFRTKNEKPLLKGAYIDTDIFVGDNQISTLSAMKSKEDLVGDIIMLLQSPMKNLVSSLQSGGQTISGLLKALEERAQ